MNSKDFVASRFLDKPTRYGCDDGDLNMTNDYLAYRGFDTLTREQFRAITSIVRLRNMFLAANPDYDMRKKKQPPLFVQLSIYDFLEDTTATQTRKLIHYFTGDESRIDQSNSRIRSSVRGVDNEHIIAAKVMLPLFASEPKLKKIRKTTDRENATDTDFEDDLAKNSQTSFGIEG
ncbi:hypothetical protein [Sulfurovum riftiae]|uniref:Uncharacterized protein n=1 Tax=Sulfurovum riftiae TaxID=1630136 RepID=A0A151CDR5_9BACT|nr:hypothetical protein [Sulfurovum riftiae]KYJ85662.1 hypothetical protein AS592_01105 [Sulfurovum riftiae]